MAATIKDVAKKAGVSAATVSLVIHNHNRISPATRRKVLKAIQQLNYHPSRSARGLVSKKSGNIGFILTDDHFSRSEPFYTQIFLGTEFQARDIEYYVLLTTVSSTFRESDPLPRFVLERNVDGIILAGKVPQSLINGLENYNIPLVFVDYYPAHKKYPVVMIDNLAGGFQAASHLLELNHHRVAFVGGDLEHPSILERFQGYKMALEKSRITFDSTLAVTDEPYPSPANGYNATKKLFGQTNYVTAIFAGNDALAIGILQFLREAGKRVPQDISIIGFDDIEADLTLDPPLTTMRVPKIELGAQSMRLMTDILENQITSTPKILVPVELIVRGSTAALNN